MVTVLLVHLQTNPYLQRPKQKDGTEKKGQNTKCRCSPHKKHKKGQGNETQSAISNEFSYMRNNAKARRRATALSH